MRRLSLLAALGLAFVALATSGCQTASDPAPLEPKGILPLRTAGVVEIYRTSPPVTLVGVVSVDASDMSHSFWLLNGDEPAPPVVPFLLTEPPVEYRLVSATPMNADQLCDLYGSRLTAPKKWETHANPLGDCGLAK